MSLPEVSVRRFVFAVMINLVIVLFGLISVNRISIDRSPDIDFSLISVTTVLPGANPDVVDSSVTNIIEGAVNSIPGIDDVRSRSARADLDRTSSMPGILLTAPSMMFVTLESTTSGLAPGKTVVTEINEKSISGERSIEIRLTDIKPNRTMTKLIITAKTKRLTDTSGKLILIYDFND